MLTGNQLRQKYLDFFVARGHKIIPSAPLVPENDPSTLFTSSGMQPLIPYLLGQPHPLGKRLVDSQKSFRSQDIDEVGDNRHTTFFEMLGNWSLGDYFKDKQLEYFFEFLTNKDEGVGLDPEKLYVSVFDGDERLKIIRNGKQQDSTPDTETIDIWMKLFDKKNISSKVANINFNSKPDIKNGRIFYYGAEKNWWSRSGTPQQMPIGEIGGPDSEVFYDFGEDLGFHKNSPWKKIPCHPNCDCGRFLEIGNSVFMQYKKIGKDLFEELPNKNVDFGGGLERIMAAIQNTPDVFQTDFFSEIISTIEEYSNAKYDQVKNKASFRVVADHLKAATFLMVDGVTPSNKAQGYMLRRLMRRAAVKLNELGGGLTPIPGFGAICNSVLHTYEPVYLDRTKHTSLVEKIIQDEMGKFVSSLDKGLKEFNKYDDNQLNALNAFNLFQTYGFPFEITEELFNQKGKKLDKNEFDEIYKAHQELSRTASAGMFKGGLQDQSEIVTRYHTATHLLHKALRDILGTHVQQKGSNITSERLRFDFSHPEKLTPDQLQLIEQTVNGKIKDNLPVIRQEMPKTQALSEGAIAFFVEKYPDTVSVYTIGPLDHWYSKELCGGPHVTSTGTIGKLKIIKEESAGAGVRRIYAKIIE
jgi:alanyl-tRNA synthetase